MAYKFATFSLFNPYVLKELRDGEVTALICIDCNGLANGDVLVQIYYFRGPNLRRSINCIFTNNTLENLIIKGPY